MKMLLAIASLAIVLVQPAFAQVACDLGVYSQYIGGTGGVSDRHPVVQGGCTKTFGNGVYVNGWVSQSVTNPGLSKTFGNEIDAVLGWGGTVAEKWSVDVHTAYYDLANTNLLHGTNGDLADVGGTLRYQATATTSIYANAESYYGIGSKGFANGWKAGIGVRTNLGNVVSVDGNIYHNHKFFGHGEFLKLTIEPTHAFMKLGGGGEVRPSIMFWQPIGDYGKTHDTQVVVGVRINW